MMRYRSDGSMMIRGTLENLQAAIALLRITGSEQNKKDLDEVFILNNVSDGPDDDTYVFGFTYNDWGWKWYESYSYVQSLEYIWSWFMDRAEQFHLDGAFIRIGEDDDIDRRSFNDGGDMISLSVSYSTEYSLDASKDKRFGRSSSPDLQSSDQIQGADT